MPVSCEIRLPASKSISNRLLVLKSLYFPNLKIANISDANDTRLMLQALNQIGSNKPVFVGDAGTVARFCTAVAAVTGSKATLIEGTQRMNERPMLELFKLLEHMGCTIQYMAKKGCLPARIGLVVKKDYHLKGSTKVSSQFLSALLMVAPAIGHQIRFTIDGKQNSASYLQMTIQLMQHLGFDIDYSPDEIVVQPFIPALPQAYSVENDWSSAAFFMAPLSLAAIHSHIFMPGLLAPEQSLQGDSQLADLVRQFGISIKTERQGVVFVKTSANLQIFQADFSSIPDLALPLAVTSIINNQPLHISGIETLQFKESNRLNALKEFCTIAGIPFEAEDNRFRTFKGMASFPHNQLFHTKSDHRVAMSAAAFSLLKPVQIENAQTTEKSFPGFWDEWRKLNFDVQLQ